MTTQFRTRPRNFRLPDHVHEQVAEIEADRDALLAALKSALAHIEEHDQTHSTRTARTMNAGRDAIARAEGRAP